MAAKSFPEQFQFLSKDVVYRELRNLVAATEARFVDVEQEVTTFEAEVAKFQTLGLQAVNDTLTPLVQQAVDQLSSISELFTAQSLSTETFGTGSKSFVIVTGEEILFVPLDWVNIAANSETPGTSDMLCRVTGYDEHTGQLDVLVDRYVGSGEYSSWTITTAPPPDLNSPTYTEMNEAIADIADTNIQELKLDGIVTFELTENARPLAPTGYETCNVYRLDNDQAWSIDSIAGEEDGKVIVIHNIGDNNITIKNESGWGTADQRIVMKTGEELVLFKNQCATLQYDANPTPYPRWRVIGGAGGGGASGTGVWTVSATPPSTPLSGEGWYDLDSATGYIWVDDGTSSQWLPAGGGGGPLIPDQFIKATTMGGFGGL